MEKRKMGTYQHFLCCPLCEELFTHPVLLPCQHNLCYGCARAQIMSPDSLNEVVKDNMLSHDNIAVSEVLSLQPQRPSLVATQEDLIPAMISENTLDDNSNAKKDGSFMLQATGNLRVSYVSKLSSPENVFQKNRSLVSRMTSSTLPTSPKVSQQAINPPKLRRCNSLSSIASASPTRSSYNRRSLRSIRKSCVKSIFCPTCKKVVELGNLGISGLYRNFALETIVGRFRSAVKAAVTVRCGYCKPPASDATKSCFDCKLSYCNECFKTVHIWGTKKASHGYVGPTNKFPRPQIVLCPEHSNEASMYCNKCKKSVCRLCKLGSGAHNNHSVSPVKLAYRKGRERLCAQLTTLKIKKEAVDAKITCLSEAFNTLERREAETREIIHSSLDDMHRLLEEKRRELLAKTNAGMREKECVIRQEMQRCHQKLLSASVASFAEEVLKETEPNFFLQTSEMVEQKLKEAIQNLTEDNDTESQSDPVAMEVDVTPVKEQLNMIDLIPANHDTDSDFNTDEHIQNEKNYLTHSVRFHWVPLEENNNIVINEEARIAQIKHSSSLPSILKGSIEFGEGEHYWEMMITSVAAQRIIVGVCNLLYDGSKPQHKHFSICSNGALLNITPGSNCSLCDEESINLKRGTCNEPHSVDGTCTRFLTARQTFVVGVRLKIDNNEAGANFYDVNLDVECRQVKLLFKRTLNCCPPFYPIVAVLGNATLKVL